MKKPRISSLPVGPRPKAGRRCRSKLISVVSCTATTLRPLHAAAVRATWGVSSAVGSTSSDDRRRCAAISPERVPPNALSTNDPLATIRSSIHSARSSRRTSPSTDLVRAIATLRESIAMKALNHVRTSDGIDLCEYRRFQDPGRTDAPWPIPDCVDAAPAKQRAKAPACYQYRGYRAALAPAVYASRAVLPPPHARLASGWLARLCREGVEPSGS